MDGEGLLLIVGESRADEFLGGQPTIKSDSRASVNCKFAAVIVGKSAEIEIGASRALAQLPQRSAWMPTNQGQQAALGVIVDGETFTGKIPRGVQLITCGISPKNTVSITSRTAEKLTLSLNRSIRTLTGKLCEPLEQPVDVPENADEYDVMAAFAAGMLLEL